MNQPQAIQQLERSERGQMGCKLLRDFLKSSTVNFMDAKNMSAMATLSGIFLNGTSSDAANIIDDLDQVIKRNGWVNQKTACGETAANPNHTHPSPAIKPHTCPPEVLKKIQARRGRFSDSREVFHCICFDMNSYLGVFGDGENGSYEWFVYTPETFETSDEGWGDTTRALQYILNREIKP